MSLNKEGYLALKPPKEYVELPEISDGGWVAAMGSHDRDSFERSNAELADGGQFAFLDNARARLLVRCLVDENGTRLFADEDAEALGASWSAPLDKLFEVAKRLNGFTVSAMEATEKNSDAAPNDSSGLTSPPSSEAEALTSGSST